jgi:UDP-GlcNAc:undecaprenyl-phosphate/decaprenyl-phosphate GlcNAc-1-phosphate transferase
MIRELLLLGSLSALLTVLLTPLVRNWFLRYRIVDQPDGRRKQHATAVPRVGGIPLGIAYVSALLLLYWLPGASPSWLANKQLLFGLVLGSAIIFVTGLIDDLAGLRPRQKLVGQLIAAGIVCLSGVQIVSLGGHAVPAWLGIPLTLIWLAVCTNAFNLIDGLDGLAAGMGLVATLSIFIAARIEGNHTLALVTLPLASGLLGFLIYNFNPASVFLGDSGSLLVGFLLGSYAIVWSQKAATLIGMAAPLMALAIPLLDVGLSIARRWLRGQPIFQGDRSHIHHKLLERGLTHRNVVLVLYAAAALCAVFALVQSFAPVGLAVCTAITFCGALIAGVEKLGYLEFHGARRALSGPSLRRSIRGEIALQSVAQRIGEAATVDDCWEAVRDASRQLGFSQIEARMDNRLFADRSTRPEANSCWELRVPLGETSYVQVGRQFNGPEPAELTPFVEMLRCRLLPRLVKVSSSLPIPEASTVGLLHLAEHIGPSVPLSAPARDGDRIAP